MSWCTPERSAPGAGWISSPFSYWFCRALICIGLIGLWNRPATDWIYGTPAMILLGYLAQYIALTSRTTAATLAQIPASMDEAAAVTGAGWLHRLLTITVPLAWPGLLVAWRIAYIFCLR
ncbi:MAG: ABC transporter permease subunit, partial [Gammaproteobacteria bacterium]